MTLEELVDKLNKLKESPSWKYNKDQIVRVRTNNRSMGAVSSSDVVALHCGFDWNRNSFLIYCEDVIYKRKTALDTEDPLE